MNSKLLVEHAGRIGGLIPLSCAELTCAESIAVFQYQRDLGFNNPTFCLGLVLFYI